MTERRVFKGLRAAMLLAVTGLWSVAGHAEMLLAESGLISGTQSFVFDVTAPSSGTFKVTLTDLDWPESLANLSFAATTSTSVLYRMNTPGIDFFSVSGPGRYFAHVAGTAQGTLGLGLYSLRIDFAPVPLPAAVWLLISALGGLALVRRKAQGARQLIVSA